MRAALVLIASLTVTGCAAPELHPMALVAGEKIGEDRIEGDPEGAHTIYYAPTLYESEEHIDERLVTVAGMHVLARSARAETGVAWFDQDGGSVGHGHGGLNYFEVMSAIPSRPLPDSRADLLIQAYDAACMLADEDGGSLAQRLEDQPELRVQLDIQEAPGGYYRGVVPCEFHDNLTTVRR